ncbi:universal stress protein [Streptomyces sp. 4N509B]|uniref:universal stress protein n=1 Tax=Streptomyces sp. 4N509B TaxID=3457413 RepID=UPI003FD5F9DB
MGNLVVVGVDGSPSSDAAVLQAAWEARWRRAALRVVHVFRRPVAATYVPPLDLSPLDRLVEEAARRARGGVSGVEVTETVLTGGTVPMLVGESHAAGLVVVGSRGVGGFSGMLLGSTAETLAAHSECPVMVVRGEPGGAGPIVVGVDGAPGGEKAVEFAFAEAALRGVGVVAVHAARPERGVVGPDVESAERVLAQVLAGRGQRYPDVVVRQEVVSGEPRETLIEASRTAPLVVVGARGRGGFLKLLLGSVSRALLHHARCSVVVVRGAA